MNSKDKMVTERKYRSRKNRPCDFCRRRKMACLKERMMENCLCCQLRNLHCTYYMSPIKKVKKDSTKNNELLVDKISEENINNDVNNDNSNSKYEKIHEDKITSVESITNSLELHNGKTTVFVGFSGDQDPFLLKKIADAKCLDQSSDTNYNFKNANITELKTPIFFAVSPTEYLDPRPGYYNISHVKEIAKPFNDLLIRSYFSMVNSVYPILSESIFLKNYHSISATLLSSLYLISYPYLEEKFKNIVTKKENQGDWFKLHEFVSQALPLEQGAATLQTVQALLLKLHRRPLIIRNANAPRHWVQTASLVALGQELGLNLDPFSWDIPLWEKRMRRRLWWAIYVHDKWESIGLSRPTHIREDDFRVEDINESDFIEDADDRVKTSEKEGVKMFIALVKLSKVLSDTLIAFYSVKYLQNKKPPEEVMAIGIELMNKLNAIESMYFPETCSNKFIGAMVSLRLAKITIALSCCRSILYADNDASYLSLNERAYNYVKGFNEYLLDITDINLNVHWWCYSRVNFSIVGTCILAFYVVASSKGEAAVWKQQIDLYRMNLKKISDQSHVTHLALLRFDTLFSKIESAVPFFQNIDKSAKNFGAILSAGKSEISKFNQAQIWGDQFDLSPFVTQDDIFLEWLGNSKYTFFPNNFETEE